MTNLELFSTRMKSVRVSRGHTQESLAEAIGVGKSAIANYEAGRNFPKAPVFKKLSDALEVPADYLTGQTDELPTVSEEEEMSFHPKIQEAIQEIMDIEGFNTQEECLAALVRERRAQLRQPTAPAPTSEPSGNPGQLEPQTRTRKKTGIESLDKAMEKLDKDVEKLKKKFE